MESIDWQTYAVTHNKTGENVFKRIGWCHVTCDSWIFKLSVWFSVTDVWLMSFCLANRDVKLITSTNIENTNFCSYLIEEQMSQPDSFLFTARRTSFFTPTYIYSMKHTLFKTTGLCIRCIIGHVCLQVDLWMNLVATHQTRSRRLVFTVIVWECPSCWLDMVMNSSQTLSKDGALFPIISLDGVCTHWTWFDILSLQEKMLWHKVHFNAGM